MAFTLIELLAVIAVLLILCGLLLPIAGMVLTTSQRVICFNNMRQLQTGSLIYASDHDGQFVSSMTELSHCSVTISNLWAETSDYKAGVLWPYILSEKTYLCPSFPRTEQGLRFKRHYSISAFIGATDCEGGVHGTHYVAHGFAQLKNASKVLCFVEEYYNGQYQAGSFPGALHAYCVGVSPANRSMTIVDPPPLWHNVGANWSFMDGHCEYKRWEGPKVLAYDIETYKSHTMSWAGDPRDERDMGWVIAGTTNGWIRPFE